MPRGAFGIGRAANDPAIVKNSVNAVPQIAPFRGRLRAADNADLAGLIGTASLPRPDLRLTVTPPDGGGASADRIDFSVVAPGPQPAPASIHLANVGTLDLRLASAPRLAGAQADDFAPVATDYTATTTLGAHQACRINLVFRPRGGSGARSAAVQLDHDLVEGGAALAALGTADEPATRQRAAGGFGALHPRSLVVLALTLAALVLHWRRHNSTPPPR